MDENSLLDELINNFQNIQINIGKDTGSQKDARCCHIVDIFPRFVRKKVNLPCIEINIYCEAKLELESETG